MMNDFCGSALITESFDGVWYQQLATRDEQ